MCNCQVCQDLRRWKSKIVNGSEAERLEVFNEMFDRIELAETDLSYHRAIMDGTWPLGKQHLEIALQKYPSRTE